MAQKKGQTVLADNLEGEVSTERALTDIQRGMMLNLFHECIGLSLSATPKYVSGINTYTGTGVVAFDKIKYLPWKDYKPVAEGKEIMVPHTGSVTTIQIPIDQMGYFSSELMSTDFTRMQQQAIYRAKITGERTQTLAATLDCEFLDLLIAAAAGQKGGIIQTKFPKMDYLNPVKFNYYKLYSEIGTQLETHITPYKIGASRKEIICIIDPRAYTELISHYKGEAILIERVLEYIQNENITPSKITNITLIRHIFLDNYIPPEVSSTFGSYDFRGVRMIFYFVGAPFIVPVFKENNGVLNKDNGNYRMGEKVMYAKGIIYGDMIKVVTDLSSVKEPLAFEEKLIANRETYNTHYGFKDNNIVIPDTLEKLRDNYQVIDYPEDEETPDSDPHEKLPGGWSQYTADNARVQWNGRYLKVESSSYPKWGPAGEDWANRQDGNLPLKNWFEFKEEVSYRTHLFKKLVVGVTSEFGYKYAVPVQGELDQLDKKLKR